MSKVELKIAPVQHKRDVGKNRAYVDFDTMKALGVKDGDVIEILGKKRTAALVFMVPSKDRTPVSYESMDLSGRTVAHS